MLPRNFSRSLRALAQAPEVRIPRTISQSSRFLTQEVRTPIRRSIATPRWYSTGAEETKAEESPRNQPPAAEESSQKEDPVKAELEAKKKEVVDITVRLHVPITF